MDRMDAMDIMDRMNAVDLEDAVFGEAMLGYLLDDQVVSSL